MRLLFLTHRLPYAPNRGDRIRAYHLLKALSRFSDVTLVSLVHDAEEASHVDALSDLVDEIHVVRVTPWRNKARALPALATARPLTHVLLDGPLLIDTVDAAARKPPSVVFAFCSGMARLASLPALESIPLVHDMVDVDSAKWSTLAVAARWPLSSIYSREARTLRRFEEEVTRRARHTLVVNARERDLLLSIAPGSRVSALANGVDAASFRPPGPPVDAPQIVFTGVFDYGPNETAALWLMSEVWPRVVAARPDARLALVGANPSSAVRRKATSSSAVIVTGAVPDVRPYLWTAAVAVAPIFMSHGVQNKVLEAIAAGLPVVTTPPVLEGLPSAVVPACRVADTAKTFAQEILRLLDLAPAERRTLAARAEVGALDWDWTLSGLQAIVTAAAKGG